MWLVSDIRRGSSRSIRSSHDVTGTDINLDFPKAQLGCEALFGSCHVADRRPTDKQAPTGDLTGFCALGAQTVSLGL